MVTLRAGLSPPEEFAMHCVRIVSATQLSANGIVESVLQKEGKWSSYACKVYERNVGQEAGLVSKALANVKGNRRQPGHGYPRCFYYLRALRIGRSGVWRLGRTLFLPDVRPPIRVRFTPRPTVFHSTPASSDNAQIMRASNQARFKKCDLL